MRLEVMEAFLEVARCRSMTIASEHLFTTQQNVSKMISGMEKDLGTKLFDRTPAGLLLTKDGEAAKQAFDDMLSTYHTLLNSLSGHADNQPELPRAIRLLLSKGAADHLQPILEKMISDPAAPLVDINEVELEDIIGDGATETQADYLFFKLPSNLASTTSLQANRFDTYELLSERLYVFTSSRSPLAEKASLSLKQLTDTPLVGFASSSDAHRSLYDLAFPESSAAFTNVIATHRKQDWEYYIRYRNAAVISTRDNMREIKHRMGDQLAAIPLRDKIMINLYMCRRTTEDLDSDNPFERAVRDFFAKTIARVTF